MGKRGLGLIGMIKRRLQSITRGIFSRTLKQEHSDDDMIVSEDVFDEEE